MFNVGDTVQLRSGGISMTVSAISKDSLQCQWFTATGLLKSAQFDPAMLKEAAPPVTLEELIAGSMDGIVETSGE